MSREWKDVVGYEGKYMVSNDGLVKSLYRNKIIKGEKTRVGYIRVSLYDKTCAKHVSVHRLVAEAFIPNPNKYTIVNHKDENRANNTVENLEWCTQSYNLNYGSRNIKVSAKSKPVVQMTDEGFILATYYSAMFAAKMLGVDCSDLYKCLRGELKSDMLYGYRWKYATTQGKNQ